MKPIRSRVRGVSKTPAKGSYTNGNEDSKKMQDPVEVFCRIRPLPDPSDTGVIALYSSTKLGLNPQDAEKRRKLVYYTFSHIFTEHADQKEVFNHVAMPLLKGFVKGENGLLFSYGVTSSGKTHTMSGETNNPGIVPRCVNTIFNSIIGHQPPKYLIKSDKLNGFEVQTESEALMERLQEAKMKRKPSKKSISDPGTQFVNDGTKLEEIDENILYTAFITYIEIYNNKIYDLLDDNAGFRSLQSKILREDSRRNVYINSVVEIEVKSAEEALDLYLLGNNRKRMETTSLNSESSRSHSILTIRLVISPSNISDMTDKSSLTISQLSLVDLAGSERCSRTNTKGARLKEAGSINNSLMALRTCLEILRENQQTGQNKIVPYRESRLTQLFKNYFEGEGKVKMIVCVNPSIKDYDETVHVMKFAEITQEVKVVRPDVKLADKENKSVRLFDELQAIRATFRSQSTPVPRVTLVDPESEEIKTLILYLKRRQESLVTPKAIRGLSDKFRLRLVQLQDERDNFEKQAKYLLPAEREKVKRMRNKLVETGVQLDKAVEQCLEKDKLIEELQMTINERDFKIRQNVVDKQKQKRKMEQVSEKMTHELDARLRRQRDYLTAAMKEQTDKLELVKDILTDKVSPEIVSKTNGSENQPEEDVRAAPCTPKPVIEERVSAGHISRRDTPVANVRYRRSRSMGEVWLEHRPANPVPLGTVFQPLMRTRKSVTKLTNMKDIVNPKQSKYLLISQNADNVGELETKLYKGDIIPTCSGGAQVIFDDVEKLKQESPTRGPATPSKVNLRRAYPATVTDKCAVSIEGHSSKKLKK